MDWNPLETVGITSLTSYEHYTQHDDTDPAGNATRQNTRLSVGKVDSFYQELRAHGSIGSGGATWLIGANYGHDKADQTFYQYVLQSSSYLSGFPPTIGVNPPIQNLDTSIANRTRTESIFGGVTVPLLAHLKLNGGIRYTDVDSPFGGRGRLATIGQICMSIMCRGGSVSNGRRRMARYSTD